jgi:hypothetical protein
VRYLAQSPGVPRAARAPAPPLSQVVPQAARFLVEPPVRHWAQPLQRAPQTVLEEAPAPPQARHSAQQLARAPQTFVAGAPAQQLTRRLPRAEEFLAERPASPSAA